MLAECVEGLKINPEGIYVDATFGGGGHSMAILEKIKGGRLIAFDQDEDAKKQAEKYVCFGGKHTFKGSKGLKKRGCVKKGMQILLPKNISKL